MFIPLSCTLFTSCFKDMYSVGAKIVYLILFAHDVHVRIQPIRGQFGASVWNSILANLLISVIDCLMSSSIKWTSDFNFSRWPTTSWPIISLNSLEISFLLAVKNICFQLNKVKSDKRLQPFLSDWGRPLTNCKKRHTNIILKVNFVNRISILESEEHMFPFTYWKFLT